MDAIKAGAGTDQPVKIVLERSVQPGAHEPFKQWIKEVLAVASSSCALQGSSVLTAGESDYFILLRFASQEDLDRWHTSPEVAELLRKGEALATAPDQPMVRSGLETWFTVPGLLAPRSAPPRWKMALVTWLALLPQALVLGLLIPKSLPFPLGVSLATGIPVAMLTWVIMPRLTKLLYSWLYAPARRLAS